MQSEIKRASTALTIFFAVLRFSCELSAQSIPFADAMELFRQHRWAEAAAAFATGERNAPGQTDALLYRGKALVNLGQFDEAATALQSYSKVHPKSDDAVYLLAYVRFRENQPKDSLQLFTDAAKLRTPTADDLKVVALDYVLLSDYDDAARYLSMSLEMDPANVEARYHLGRVRYQQNRFDLAIEAFQEVLRRDPQNLKAQNNLGLCLDAENKTDEAIASYRKAIALDANSTTHREQPYLNLGMLLARSNHFDEAVPLLVQASQITPRSSKVHYELGKTYFSLNRVEDAQKEAEQAVSLQSDDGSAHYLLGRIYQRLGKKDLADREFSKTQDMLRSSDSAPINGMASGVNPH